MDEYIKRADAINARGRSCDRKCAECDFAIEGDSWCEGEVFVVDLLRIPAADVRPVVLCNDCKWYQIDELKKDGTEDRRYKPSVCVLAEQRRDTNHFCADGKKRGES